MPRAVTVRNACKSDCAGVWVVHPQQGGEVIYEHREKSWGDNVMESDKQGLLNAIDQLPGSKGLGATLPGFVPASVAHAPPPKPPIMNSGGCGPNGC